MAKKLLVACFSATGTTARAARRVADLAGADLFEIEPTQPYSRADLNWMDKKSRSSVEMNDPAARPALAKAVPDLEGYDVIAVGFPIWWYREPRIIDTFLESCDLSGKTLTCFATSGGSGLGDTAEHLRACAPGAQIAEGLLLNRAGDEKIKNWLDALL